MTSDQLSITCPVCQRTSYNENDWRWGYCGNCNQYTGIPAMPVSRNAPDDPRFKVYEMADGSRYREMSVREVDQFLSRQGGRR